MQLTEGYKVPSQYDNAQYERGYHTERHPRLMVDDNYFQARADAASRLYFSRVDRNCKLFEFGCGIGQNIANLPNGAGWDVSAEALDACRRRGLKVYAALEDVPVKAWDIVFCRHALEHIEHPLEALIKMRELLKPSGELYLILPKEGHRKSLFLPDLNQHLYCWNFRAINNLVYRAGFVPYRNTTRYCWGYGALLPFRRILGASIYSILTQCAGLIGRSGELVIRARVQDSGERI